MFDEGGFRLPCKRKRKRVKRSEIDGRVTPTANRLACFTELGSSEQKLRFKHRLQRSNKKDYFEFQKEVSINTHQQRSIRNSYTYRVYFSTSQ